MNWHADTALLERYASDDVDEARAYSLEAHLLACETCRGRLAGLADRERLDRMWAEVIEAVDAPRPGVVERTLVRLGTREHVARLLAATPSLRLSWFAAEAVALGFAVLAARTGATAAQPSDFGLLLFLMVAALLPLAGVAVAYGPGVDPTYEVGVASPMRGYGLFFIRAAAVLATSIALAGIAALALPQLDWTAAAWLLPSLAMTLGSLALSTAVRPLAAAGLVALAWMTVALGTSLRADDDLIAFRGAGQIVFMLIIAVSVAVLSARREAFEKGRND